jgi:hypothetical protein
MKEGNNMLKEFDPESIKQGQHINFGAYGNLYVCNTNYNEKSFWVTDIKADRKNPDARGWSIRKAFAVGKAK